MENNNLYEFPPGSGKYYDKKKIDEILSGRKKLSEVAPSDTYAQINTFGNIDNNPDFLDAIKVGLESSALGLAIRGKMPDPVTGEFSTPERLVMQASNLLADLPVMAIGGLVGGAAITGATGGVGAPVAPFIAAGSSFALPTAIKETLINMYTEGDVEGMDDFINRLTGVLKETAKSFVVGIVTQGAAGAGERIFGKALLGTKKTLARELIARGATTAGEVGALVSSQSLIEGKAPTKQELMDAAVLIGGFKMVKSLKNVYNKTNIRPADLVYALEKGGYDKRQIQNILREPEKNLGIITKHLPKATIINPKAFRRGIIERAHEKQGKMSSVGESYKQKTIMDDPIIEAYSDKSLFRALDKLKTRIVDMSANAKNALLSEDHYLAKEALNHFTTMKGASTAAEIKYNEYYKRIIKGLSPEDEVTLREFAEALRIITIENYKPKYKSFKSPEEARTWMSDLKRNNPELYNKVYEKTNILKKASREVLDILKEAEVYNDEQIANLLSKGFYVPSKVLHYIDSEWYTAMNRRKLSMTDPRLLKKLKEGTEAVVDRDWNKGLAQMFAHAYRVSMENKANKKLYELTIEDPKNAIGLKSGKKTSKPPPGFSVIKVRLEGETKSILAPDWFAKEWIWNDPHINSQLAHWISNISGTRFLKMMATGTNPGFAISNFFRDVAHIWLTTSEYSKFAPKAAFQMGRDLASVATDAIFRKGRYKNAVEEGIGMSLLTHQGALTNKLTGKLAKVQKVLGYVGETSEIWTRLALRERAMRNGKPSVEATAIARNYLDFSQGGVWTKALDVAMPYLNAAVQGTRGIFRAAKYTPGEFAFKVAQLGALTMGLYFANKSRNPEAYDAISEHSRTNYFNITTGLSFTDKDGNKRHYIIRLAKDQGQRAITAVFENFARMLTGEEVDIENVVEAAKQIIPIMPTESLPPLLDAILGYASNYDFWRDEKVWKGYHDIKPEEEYNDYTNPAFVIAGKALKASPERLKFALTQYTTYGNLYTYLVGEGITSIIRQIQGKDNQEKVMGEIIDGIPDVRRFLKVTAAKSAEKVREAFELRKEENTQRFKLNKRIEEAARIYYTTPGDELPSKQVAKARKMRAEILKGLPEREKNRLMSRFKRYGKLVGIPDKAWWLALGDVSPEARATLFWLRLQEEKAKGNTDKIHELHKYKNIVPGFNSKPFRVHLNKLKRKRI